MSDKELKSLLTQYQEQTCGNFSDINDDIDDIRGMLANIEDTCNHILKVVCEVVEKN